MPFGIEVYPPRTVVDLWLELDIVWAIRGADTPGSPDVVGGADEVEGDDSIVVYRPTDVVGEGAVAAAPTVVNRFGL